MTRDRHQHADDYDRLSTGEHQIQQQQRQQQKQRQQHQNSAAAPNRELPEKQHQSKHNPVSEGLQIDQFGSDQ